MAERLNPPHDRVDLTPAEVRTVQRLEAEFVARADGAAVDARLPSAGLRCRLLSWSVRWARFAPLLLPIGLVVMVVALSASLVVSAFGALLVALGMVATSRQIWFRARRQWARHHHPTWRPDRKNP
jgi:hypothetical protein